MADVSIVGGGAAACSAGDLLERAGFSVNRSIDLEGSGHEPIILGEAPNAFSLAREAIATGRHLLLASPQTLTVERLELIFENRRRAQAVLLWNERRHHPGYKFVQTSIEADNAWTPRFVRIESRSTGTASKGLLQWRCLESLALIAGLTDAVPVAVAASAVTNPRGGAPDLLRSSVTYSDLEAHLEVGFCEAVERREILIAGADRKAFVDELDESVPLRLIDGAGRLPHRPRCVACPAATPDELARRQCLAFLEATRDHALAMKEGLLWGRALAAFHGIEASLSAGGAAVKLGVPIVEPRFHLVENLPGALNRTPVPA